VTGVAVAVLLVGVVDMVGVVGIVGVVERVGVGGSGSVPIVMVVFW
jgi:hypothetical protein